MTGMPSTIRRASLRGRPRRAKAPAFACSCMASAATAPTGARSCRHSRAHFASAAWDARGYGDSDDYEGPLAFDDFVADLLRVLDHFGVERAHLVGLSMGGRIAMRTALLHPERVATLTLVDTHDGFDRLSPEQRQAFVDSRRAPLLAGKEPADIAEAVARSLVGPHATAEHLQELIDSIAALHKASYIKSLEATVNQVDARRHPAIRAPAHFIVGAEDPPDHAGHAPGDGGQARATRRSPCCRAPGT